MDTNSRKYIRMAEVGSNLDYSYGGSPSNIYNTFGNNNYPGNLENMQNNVAGGDVIRGWNNQPYSSILDSRFNAMVPYLMEGTEQLTRQQNQNIQNLTNEMSNTFSGNTRARNLPYLNRNMSSNQLISRNELNQTADAQVLNDSNAAEVAAQKESFIIGSNNDNRRNAFNDYRLERDYRNGYLTETENQRNLTNIVICVVIGGFMLFMLFQLYLNQKRIEYMLEVYKITPVNNPYYHFGVATNN